MVELSVALAVLALIVATVSLFGYSSLLSMIRSLESEMLVKPPSHSFLAGSEVSLVLTTEQGCFACVERVEEFVTLVETLPESVGTFIVHSGDPSKMAGHLPDRIKLETDPRRLGSLGVGMFPSLVVVDATGKELARTIVGNQEALVHIVDWALEQLEKEKV